MRANRPPARKPIKRTLVSPATTPDNDQSRFRAWLTRLWLLCIAFALATLADIFVLIHYRAGLTYTSARGVAISIYVLFVACELCGLGALLIWLYLRAKKKRRGVVSR